MSEPVQSREITLTRVYDAPPDRVYALWTEARHLKEWWGPDGFSVGRVESDPRPGGRLLIEMIGPEMTQSMEARYVDVVPGERLEVASVVDGPDGSPFLESGHTVHFRDLGGKTEVTVEARAAVFDPAGLMALEGMLAGWRQSMQRLDDTVRGSTDRQFAISRVFDAPPDAVFARWSDPEHLARWWGPEGFSLTVDSFDFRPGGEWRFTMHGPDGTDHHNRPDERLVFHLTDRAGSEDASLTFVVTFDAFGERTALSMRHVFATAEARDATELRSGAAQGAAQTLDRLGRLLEASGA
jgi:uncharacterized protein YndB with AHSA1/START domain